MINPFLVVDRADDNSRLDNLAPPHGFKLGLDDLPIVTPGSLWLLSGLILILVLMGLTTYWIISLWKVKRRSNDKRTVSHDQVTEWARLKIEIQKIQEPVGDHLDFASRVSLCLRRAIELKTNLPLAERTSEEILRILNKEIVHDLSKDDVMRMLWRLDEVRFADSQLQTGEARNLIDQLKNMVENLDKTRPSSALQASAGDPPVNMKEQIFG